MIQRALVELVGQRPAGLRLQEHLLAKVRHLLVGVLHIEVDQVCQRAHFGAWTRGEIGGDTGLELILQHQSLGSDISALEVGAQLGMGGDLDVVDQLSAALAQNLERLGEHAIGVLAVFGVELSRDADACSAQRVGLQILTVIFSRFGNGAQYRGRIRHRARMRADGVLGMRDRHHALATRQPDGRFDADDATRR